MSSSSQDHAQTITDGQGNPALADTPAEPKRKFRWPWMHREITLGYRMVGVSGGVFGGRPYIALCPLKRAHEPDERIRRKRLRRGDVVIWLDTEEASRVLRDAIALAEDERIAHRQGWHWVGRGAWRATFEVNIAETADGAKPSAQGNFGMNQRTRTMREEIVERVKNELSKHIRVDAAGLSPAVVQHFVLGLDEAAQAAITATLEALREPTLGMLEAGEAVECEGSSGFTAMIEAAIKEMGDG